MGTGAIVPRLPIFGNLPSFLWPSKRPLSQPKLFNVRKAVRLKSKLLSSRLKYQCVVRFLNCLLVESLCYIFVRFFLCFNFSVNSSCRSDHMALMLFKWTSVFLGLLKIIWYFTYKVKQLLVTSKIVLIIAMALEFESTSFIEPSILFGPFLCKRTIRKVTALCSESF